MNIKIADCIIIVMSGNSAIIFHEVVALIP